MEIALPSWPWRLYCLVRGHQVVGDQCGRPEHRFCIICSKAMPYAAVSDQPSRQGG